MTKHEQREQLESQIKELVTAHIAATGDIVGYTLNFGEGAAVTIEKGKWNNLNKEMHHALNRATDDDWDRLFAHNPEVLEQLRQSYNKGVIDGRKFQKEDDLNPEPVKHPASEPPDNDRDVWVKLLSGQEFRGWFSNLNHSWFLFYHDSQGWLVGDWLRPGDTVVEWNEIE